MEYLLDLTTLALVSECPSQSAILLLSAAINIKNFKTGINCHLTDGDILTVLEKNEMRHLVSWNMAASKHLTMDTVHLLISNCDNLQSIEDLNYWENCCKVELEQLRKSVKENNVDLDIGESIE